ncbi:MAG: hypothetical protein Fur0032_11370 [Terrimicrobiaceae bacterium]
MKAPIIYLATFSLLVVLKPSMAEEPPAAREAFFPIKVYGPSFRPSGAVLSGTAGNIAGSREPAEGVARDNPWLDWWNGTYMLGGDGQFGPDYRGRLKDRGISFDSNYQGAFFGVVDSQKGSRGFWNQQLNLAAQINLGDLLDAGHLRGISFYGAVRYRDSWPESNPNEFVEAQSMFNPTNWQSGTQFRVLGFGIQLDTDKLLPVEHMLTLKLGWIQPQKEFIDQPLSKLFLNNAVNSAKGVGGNIPFSSSFSTWGGVLTVRPHENFYFRNGLFMSFPSATASQNHGLAFSGFGPDPALNGLFYMGEAGYTPLVGPSRLPGKYAFGGYFYGLPGGQAVSWNGTPTDGQYGFYFQADQMLYREPSPPVEQAGSSGKNPVASKGAVVPEPSISNQGLKAFNLLMFAPGYARSNVFPFYFQTGLVYAGLLPARDLDLSMISLGYGAYQGGVSSPERSYTAVLEAAYRYQINGWSYAQPFVQYFIRPDGTGDVQNATVLGFSVGVVF